MTDSQSPEDKKPPGVQPDAPPPDEFLGRDKKKKKKADKGKRPPKTQVEEQIDEAVARSAIQEQRKLQKKQRIKMGAGAVGFLLFCWLIYYGLKPFEGDMPFGICKVFLEGTVRYPTMLRLSTVEEFETSVRIWYTKVDAFGEYRMEPIQCYYKNDETRGTYVEKVLIDRREVDPRVVDNFNRALPAILRYPPDLTLPTPLPDSLEGLQINADSLRPSVTDPPAQ